MSPALIAALISQLGVPELMRWLAQLRQDGVEVVTEEAAIERLGTDVDEGNRIGGDFLDTHPKEQ